MSFRVVLCIHSALANVFSDLAQAQAVYLCGAMAFAELTLSTVPYGAQKADSCNLCL